MTCFQAEGLKNQTSSRLTLRAPKHLYCEEQSSYLRSAGQDFSWKSIPGAWRKNVTQSCRISAMQYMWSKHNRHLTSPVNSRFATSRLRLRAKTALARLQSLTGREGL